jgi:exodeoxyribonuclease VII small subunit
MAKRPVRPPAEMPYEQAFQELEAAVRQLESGERPLEEALALFERGQLLAARCSELLEAAELKLKTLVSDGTSVDLDELEPED